MLVSTVQAAFTADITLLISLISAELGCHPRPTTSPAFGKMPVDRQHTDLCSRDLYIAPKATVKGRQQTLQ